MLYRLLKMKSVIEMVFDDLISIFDAYGFVHEKQEGGDEKI